MKTIIWALLFVLLVGCGRVEQAGQAQSQVPTPPPIAITGCQDKAATCSVNYSMSCDFLGCCSCKSDAAQ